MTASPGEITPLKLTRPITRPDGIRSIGKDALISTDATGLILKVVLFEDIGAVSTVKTGFDGLVSVTPIGNTACALEGQLDALMRAPGRAAAAAAAAVQGHRDFPEPGLARCDGRRNAPAPPGAAGQPARPSTDAVAMSSSSSDMEARPEHAKGFSTGFSAYFSSSEGLTLAMFT